MKRPIRQLIFATFIALFVVGAPVVVLYTAGYRYNPRNGHIVRTGVLSVSSTPRGATILLDGATTGRTTPYVFTRMTPGTYSVTLTRDGYHTYEDDITVESGKSAYVSDIALFAASEPLLLNEESGAITTSTDGATATIVRAANNETETWEYTVRNRSYTLVANTPDTNAEDDTPVTQTVGMLTLTEATNGVEVYSADAPDTLLALLPSAHYTIALSAGRYAVLTTENHKLYVIDLYAKQPIALAARATAWDAQNGTLVWTDGVEVNTFVIATSAATFVTRQSTPILDVALDTEGQAVFVATATTIQSFTRTRDTAHITTLATMDTIEQCFTSTRAPDALYVVGTMNGVRGFYELGLR